MSRDLSLARAVARLREFPVLCLFLIQAKGTSMSRHPSIKNLKDMEYESHYLNKPAEKYRVRKRVGKTLGTKNLGLNVSRLAPGQVSSEFHFHTKEEELIVITKGRVTLRLGNETFVLEEEDVISFPPNGEPHQLINNFDLECLYLEMSTRHPDDRVVYPEKT
ncbi:MAG: cupin domain-containing protein [Oligoflexales bacterium]